MTLNDFLSDPVNSVTRERIFFNRLYYDLKLAAARRGYALAVFEPEVDRDSYDIVLDDGDVERRFQLKTRMAKSSTKTWEVTRRFIRPNEVYGERLNLAPADCGFGGGVVLIEIDAATDDPVVTYSYTDYFFIEAHDIGLWYETTPRPKAKGPSPSLRRTVARKALGEIGRGSPRQTVWLEKRLFVRASSADGLLALMGFHNVTDCHLPADRVLRCLEKRFEADIAGVPAAALELADIRVAEYDAKQISSVIDEPALALFVAPPRSDPSDRSDPPES